MKKCPKCNREIESNSVFCEYCGYKVKKPVWPWFIVMGMLSVGIASAILVDNSHKEKVKEETFFQGCSTIENYEEYLKRYPKGRYVEQASDNIQKMRADSIQDADIRHEKEELLAFNNCSSANSCRQYLKDYPDGSHVNAVVAMLERFITDSLQSIQPHSDMEIEDRIHLFIKDYSRLTETSDKQLIHSLVTELYASQVKRYFNAYDIDPKYVAECYERYDEKFLVYGKHSNVRWNTVSYTLTDDMVYLTYIEDYSIDRKDKSKYSIFVLEKHFELNMDFHIVSVYDVQLSKSKK